jgi:hypothetical protein
LLRFPNVLILDLAYLLVFILLSPLWLLLLILKPAMRAGLRERFVICCARCWHGFRNSFPTATS